MGKCIDCLHYEACVKHYTQGQLTMINGDCSTFTDRSEWVHLPCKVGDKLYEITSRKTISEYQVTAIRIELFGIFVDWKITQGFVDRYISDMPVGEIGKTVFLTPEEAEKALERSER